jgi:hypothetical protein
MGLAKKWTGNEKATFVLSVASLGLAVLAFMQSLLSKDMSNAIARLASIANETRVQTSTLGQQTRVLSSQLTEQKQQTKVLSDQASATNRLALSSQDTAEISQRQLVASEKAFVDSRARASAQARYAMRVESARTYFQARAQYETALRQIRNRLPFDIEEIRVVDQLTASDLVELSDVLDPVISARRNYDASWRASLAPWPRRIRELMVHAGNHGGRVGHCYDSASLRALDETEVAQVKWNLRQNCRNLGREHAGFLEDSEIAENAMINELYNAAFALGVDPEILSPRTKK